MYKIINEKQYRKFKKLYDSYLDEILMEVDATREVQHSWKKNNSYHQTFDGYKIYRVLEPLVKDPKGIKADYMGSVFNFVPYIPMNVFCQLSIEQIQALIKATGK